MDEVVVEGVVEAPGVVVVSMLLLTLLLVETEVDVDVVDRIEELEDTDVTAGHSFTADTSVCSWVT